MWRLVLELLGRHHNGGIVTAACRSCSNCDKEKDKRHWSSFCSSFEKQAKRVSPGHSDCPPHPSSLWWKTAVGAPSVTCISIKQSQVLLPVATSLQRCLGGSHYRLYKRKKKMFPLCLRIAVVCFFSPSVFFSLCSRHRLYFHFSRSLVPCDKVIGEVVVAKATALSRDVSRWHARSPVETKGENALPSKTWHFRSGFYSGLFKNADNVPKTFCTLICNEPLQSNQWNMKNIKGSA